MEVSCDGELKVVEERSHRWKYIGVVSRSGAKCGMGMSGILGAVVTCLIDVSRSLEIATDRNLGNLRLSST